MLAFYKSDTGLIRKINEDSFVCLPPHLMIVADGMGGHAAGEVASSKAVRTVSNYISTCQDMQQPQFALEQAIMEANHSIYQMAQSPDYAGMGTTLTAVWLDSSYIYWGHVGDSRLYIIRGDSMIQLTNDHSLVGELLRHGNITKEEAVNHPNRNILTRAVGTSDSLKVDTGTCVWSPGDSLLLCTDGLTTVVSEANILQNISRGPAFGNEGLEQMIQQANEAGGYDNITAIWVYNDGMNE